MPITAELAGQALLVGVVGAIAYRRWSKLGLGVAYLLLFAAFLTVEIHQLPPPYPPVHDFEKSPVILVVQLGLSFLPCVAVVPRFSRAKPLAFLAVIGTTAFLALPIMLILLLMWL